MAPEPAFFLFWGHSQNRKKKRVPDPFLLVKSRSLLSQLRIKTLGPVSRRSRDLFGPEKPVVKLQSAYFEKLILQHVFNVRKTKRIAKFDGLEPRRCEDIKGIVAQKLSGILRTGHWSELRKISSVNRIPGTGYDEPNQIVDCVNGNKMYEPLFNRFRPRFFL